MNPNTGHLFESLKAAQQKGVDLGRLIMIPGPLIEDAKRALAGKAETVVPLDTETSLGKWAKQKRTKSKPKRTREKRKQQRKIAAASRRKNRMLAR